MPDHAGCSHGWCSPRACAAAARPTHVFQWLQMAAVAVVQAARCSDRWPPVRAPQGDPGSARSGSRSRPAIRAAQVDSSRCWRGLDGYVHLAVCQSQSMCCVAISSRSNDSASIDMSHMRRASVGADQRLSLSWPARRRRWPARRCGRSAPGNALCFQQRDAGSRAGQGAVQSNRPAMPAPITQTSAVMLAQQGACSARVRRYAEYQDCVVLKAALCRYSGVRYNAQSRGVTTALNSSSSRRFTRAYRRCSLSPK